MSASHPNPLAGDADNSAGADPSWMAAAAHEISLGTMWMDDVELSDANRQDTLPLASTLEEESLRLLQSAGAGANVGSGSVSDRGDGKGNSMRFDDDDEVGALFPMLSESSFDYDEELGPTTSTSRMDGSTILDDNAFPNDLSPILCALTPPKRVAVMQSKRSGTKANAVTLRKKGTVAAKAVTTVAQGNSSSALTDSTAVLKKAKENAHQLANHTTPKRARKKTRKRAASAVLDTLDSTPSVSSRLDCLLRSPEQLAVTRKRRRLRSTTLSTIYQWSEHEQNVFFSMFKAKWMTSDEHQQEAGETNIASSLFKTLLLQRFESISTKLKTKSSSDVQLFYMSVLHYITDLLEEVETHDINFTNPDELRIALWCWHKLSTDDLHRQEFQAIEAATVERKKHMGKLLFQSIVRSRRQMLKSKAASRQEEEDAEQSFASLEGLLKEALAHSNLVSLLPLPEVNPEAIIHHPAVRKKSPRSACGPQTGSITTSMLPNGAVLPVVEEKGTQSASAEVVRAFTNRTPLKPVVPDNRAANSFVTPEPNARKTTSGADVKDIKYYTPARSSRKKIYIKFRMVPRDSRTRDQLTECGCNPKVELKLSSSKRVSDVVDHMTKKWSKVQSQLPSNTRLHFFEKDAGSPKDGSNTGVKTWSQRHENVTCLDIWKKCGKMKSNEHVVVVSYQWRNETGLVGDENAHGPASPLLPADKFNLSWMDDGSSSPLFDVLNDHDSPKRLDFGFDVNEQAASPMGSLNLDEFPQHTDTVGKLDAETSSSRDKTNSPKKQSLQSFSEAIAFESNDLHIGDDGEKSVGQLLDQVPLLPEDALSDLLEYSPNSGRPRRRITPTLVQTDECHI